ncbi:MAG: tetratricopeptide repeat protein [Succinivibrio sp.]|nr:tetratricopeptide repeat protein [Succinivibrio sp.]
MILNLPLKPWCNAAWRAAALLTAAWCLPGCSGFTGSSGGAELYGPFSVPPRQIMFTNIAPEEKNRFEDVLLGVMGYLSTGPHTKTELAEAYYAASVASNALNLNNAEQSFTIAALSEKPDFGEAFASLANIRSMQGSYNEAIDSYGAALELDSNLEYSYFNRGLTLYYAGRFSAALQDLKSFYIRDPLQPYRMLWLYYVERELSGVEEAKVKLKKRLEHAEKTNPNREWGYNLVRYTLGEMTEDELLENVALYRHNQKDFSEHLCEAYFYIGKMQLLLGKDKLGYDYMSLCQATNVTYFLEVGFAELEQRLLEYRYGLRPDKLLVHSNS